MKKILPLLLGALALTAGACRSAPEPEPADLVVDTSLLPADMREMLGDAGDGTPVLVDFHASW